MSGTLKGARVALAAVDGADGEAVAQGLRQARAEVELCDSAPSLSARAMTGDLHAAILATGRPHDLPKSVVRALLSAQSDLSVTFLVPDRTAHWQCAALAGACLDQVQELALPPDELVQLLATEVSSVLAAQPQYLIVCVDDDVDFLGSLEALLPSRLERRCPRFRLRFAFHVSPLEALATVRSAAEGELAVIVSDQVMPEINGVELLAAVKAACPHAQRVLLTGYAGLDSAVVAINEQVLDKYLLKPIEQPIDFVNTIEHLLREYHLGRSRSAERHRLLAQFELIQALSRSRDLPSTLAAVDLCLSEQLLPSRRWGVLLREEDDLRVTKTSSLPPGWAPEQRLPACSGLPGWVLQNNRPVFALRARDLPLGVRSPAPPPLMAVPLAGNGLATGVILLTCPRGAPPLTRAERLLLSFVADAAAVTMAGLMDRQVLQEHYVATMSSLMEAVEAKDVYTRGHTDRVCQLGLALARACGVAGQDLRDLEHAAMLHDIGKIAVPDAIIGKPGPLTAEEFAVMKQHPARGERILRHLRFLHRARLILRSHHEHYDGTGYPDGLTGEEIPMGARILAIADCYDAMTSARPYRAAMSAQTAMAEIQRQAGRQFDPALVTRFTDLMRQGLRETTIRSRRGGRQETRR